MGRPFVVHLKLSRLGEDCHMGGVALACTRVDASGPRAFVVGHSERVDLLGPGALSPRHLCVICVPREDGVHLRVLCLHPDRGLIPLRWLPPPQRDEAVPNRGATLPGTVGGVIAFGRVRVLFEGYILEVRAELERPSDALRASDDDDLGLLPKGEQLAFHSAASVRPLGTAVSSVTGPRGGGHAIPALVVAPQEDAAPLGNLVLRSRAGVHRLEPTPQELRRGLLVGRSRRCALGRGFDENDGLSRLHALVIAIDDGVYAFDLASRYGLRDVARPSRLVLSARLDDGAGCLVYGAGHLVAEQ